MPRDLGRANEKSKETQTHEESHDELDPSVPTAGESLARGMVGWEDECVCVCETVGEYLSV